MITLACYVFLLVSLQRNREILGLGYPRLEKGCQDGDSFLFFPFIFQRFLLFAFQAAFHLFHIFGRWKVFWNNAAFQ